MNTRGFFYHLGCIFAECAITYTAGGKKINFRFEETVINLCLVLEKHEQI